MSKLDENEPYWCEQAPTVPRVWSSSSLKTIAECPRRFQLSYVDGWTGGDRNIDLEFGTAWHGLLESYWLLRTTGKPHDKILRELVVTALSTDLPPPTKPSNKGKTPLGLARSLVWYFEQYKQDEINDLVTVGGDPAIELHFSVALPLTNPDGEPYYLQGYVDQLRSFAGNHAVWDYKTTSGDVGDYYADRFLIDIQNQIYLLAAQALTDEKYTIFIADAIGLGVTYTSFLRIAIQITPNLLDEALLDINSWIRLAETCAETNYYPKNTSACTFCQFKGICDKDPVSREAFLTTTFTKKRREFVGRNK